MQLLALTLALASVASAHTAGFTLSSKNVDGTCKTVTQWNTTFNALQALPATNLTGNITSARLFSASDCAALASAVPAAIAANQSLLVGLWTTDAAHFANDTAALVAAIQQYGDAWMTGVAVGSEDLWRGANNASNLAAQINSTRAVVRSLGSMKPVGHVDDYSVWTSPVNAAVINASDFIGANIHPYFGTSSITTANSTFWAALLSVQQAVAAAKNITLNTTTTTTPATKHTKAFSTTSLTPASLAQISQLVWVTETGWAVNGPSLGEAEASVENAATYWNAVACGAANQSVPLYWPADVDHNQLTSFGAFSSAGVNQFVAAC